MIFWSKKLPRIDQGGEYVIIYKDKKGNKYSKITYWDGYRWTDINYGEEPIKWSKI